MTEVILALGFLSLFVAMAWFGYRMNKHGEILGREFVNFKKMTDERFSEIGKDVALASNAVSICVDGVQQRATFSWDLFVTTRVVLICLALCRGLYSRLRSKEKKESLREADAFKIFDFICLLSVVPLFAKDGAGAAVRLWRSLKTIISMVRDTCGALHVFGRLFSTKDDKHPGLKVAEELEDVCEDLAGRVEERVQGIRQSGEIFVCTDCGESVRTHDEEHKCSHEFAVPRTSPIRPVATPVVKCPCGAFNSTTRIRCKGCGKQVDLVGVKGSTEMLNALRKVWSKQEDQMHLKSITSVWEDKPWLMPVVLVILFAFLIIVVRYARREGEVEEKERHKKKHKKTDFVDSNAVRNPNAPDEALFYKDEQGNLMRRVGRRAAKSGTGFAINTAAGEYGQYGRMESVPVSKKQEEVLREAKILGKDLSFDFGAMVSALTGKKVDESGDGDGDSVSEDEKSEDKEAKCIVANCDRKCGKWHPAVSDKAAKRAAKKKAAKAKRLNEAKESQVNGSPTRPGTVCGSIGWAETKSSAMNFTCVYGGLVVCGHIFAKDDSDIRFSYGCLSTVVPRSEGKIVGNDLLYFKFPKGLLVQNKSGQSIPAMASLRCAKPAVGEKVSIVSYESHKDCLERSPSVDQGRVALLDFDKGREKGLASYSSKDGYCGSPILNVHGHCVGFHNATTTTQTIFIPVSDHFMADAPKN
jgi:hypothetical protein